MKTPEEIKRGLECCTPLDGEGECTGFDALCRLCPYDSETWCADKMRKDVLTYITQIETQLRDVTKMVSPAKPAPKWISVKDRLPKELEKVLVSIRTRYATQYEIAYFDDGEWVGPEGYLHESFVTHWMPIPEPPKGE